MMFLETNEAYISEPLTCMGPLRPINLIFNFYSFSSRVYLFSKDVQHITTNLAT